ncbi:MAG: DnaJ domain-containing protein [Candidatus Sabulitectum sp.]|nr:DnaJ domain-containing protein [Candidatus Sabulitectum sp.]
MKRGIENTAADFYQMLNVKRNADQDTIEMAYARMALKHHPDVAGDSPKVQEKFAQINEAYMVLSKPHERLEYDQRLSTPEVEYQEEVISTDEGRGAEESASSSGPQSSEAATRQVEKQANPSSGLMSRKKLERIKYESRNLIGKGDFWRATELMRKAVIAYPRDIELRKLLAKSAAGRGRLREAVEELKKAGEVEYFNPEIHYLIGDMYLQGNQIDSAEKSFTNALSWQEDYGSALKGLEKIRALKNKKLPWWKKLLRTGK